MTNTQTTDDFSTWQHGRGYSPATIARRRVTLASLGRWAHPLPVLHVDTLLIEDWLGSYTSPRTRHSFQSDTKVFFDWAVRRRMVPENPCTDLDAVRIPRSLPRPVPTTLVPAIVDLANTGPMRLAVALAGYGGLRRAEIAHLDAEDVSLELARLIVREGKGGKDRAVPIIPPLAQVLDEHAPRYGLIVGWRPSTVGQRIAQHLRACGIDATGHQLRHSFATEMYRVTRDLRLTADALGHVSVTETEVYSAFSRDWGLTLSMYAPSSAN